MEKTSEIKFKVELDENKLPKVIHWEAPDAGEKSTCKSVPPGQSFVVSNAIRGMISSVLPGSSGINARPQMQITISGR